MIGRTKCPKCDKTVEVDVLHWPRYMSLVCLVCGHGWSAK